MSFEFGTVIPAMVTPFDDKGEVDYDAAVKLADYLVKGGCDGLVLSGTTGESPTLTDEEKIQLLKAVKKAVDVPVTMGVGSNNTKHTIELAKKAEAAGADALLVVTPYYNKPSQAGVVEHFKQVSQATKLPIMLYDIPGRTGIPLTYETLVELSRLKNIVAVKDAKGDMAQATRVMRETDLEYFSGDDALTLPWMSLGAKGVVSVTAHIVPKEFRTMVDAASKNDFEAAQKTNAEIENVIRATMDIVPGGVAVKTFLHMGDVLPNAEMRLPLVEPTSEELAKMKENLTS